MADGELQRLVVRFEADISKLEEKVNRIPGIVNRAARGVESSGLDRSLDRTIGRGLVQNLASSTAGLGQFSSALSALGPVGITATVTMAATAAAISAVTHAAKEADALKSAADNIGITAERLQELRFAGAEFSVSAQDTDQAIQNLNAALGAMRSGVGDGKLKEAFEALGFTQEQINSVSSVSDLLPMVADRLQAVGNQAEQVQLARKLGIESLLPLLRQGGDHLQELQDKARALGLVMSEDVVASMAATNRELEVADQRMEIAGNRMSASLAPAATAVKNAFADATTALAGFITWLDRLGGANASANLDELGANLSTARTELDTLRRTNGGLVGSQLSPAARANLIAKAEEKVRAAEARFNAASGTSSVIGGVPSGRGFGVSRPGNATTPSGGGGGGGSAARPDQDHWEYDEQANIMYWVVANGTRTPWANVGGVGVGAIPGTEGTQGNIQDQGIPGNVSGLGTPGADAAIRAQEAEDDLRRTFRDTFRDGVVAALHGDLKEFLIQTLADAASRAFEDALNNVADMFFNFLKQSFGGMGSGNGWGNAIASFAGFKAGGGAVGNGQWAVVGEKGPEAIEAVAGGLRVHPNSALRSLSTGKSAGATVVNAFDLRGAVLTQDLLDQMNAIGAQAAVVGGQIGEQRAQRSIPAMMAKQQSRAIR